MYRLLIVEDEVSILEGLRNFNWNLLNIECAGCCGHGIEALKFMEENEPDILLTDIRMPIMSGLELIEKTKHQYPSVIMVVLTGYANFDYAYHSVKNGVCDYLLKPVNHDELKSTFTRITGVLDERYKANMDLRLAQDKKQRLTTAIRKKFLKELLFSPMDEDEIIENAGLCEMTLNSEDCFVVAIMSLDRLKRKEIFYSEKDKELILYAFDNILKEYFENNAGGYYWVNPKNCDIYFLFEREQTDLEQLTQYICGIRECIYRIHGLFKSTISVSLGSFKEKVTDILQSAKEARAALENISGDEDFAVYNPDVHMTKPDIINETPKPAPVELNISAQTSMHIINNAVRYINENYTRVLTLEEVANAVYTNTTYLSYLFKKATDVKFINYLTNLRIQKAKELLKDPKMKIQAVSEAVGYEDQGYFSQIFKKYVGMSPFEWRSKKTSD